MKRFFIVYYTHDNGKTDLMRLNLAEDEWEHVKEIFYDSCPNDGAKILEISEVKKSETRASN